MKISDVRLTGLTGGTVEGGWAEELAPEDNVHTVVEVITDDGLIGAGSGLGLIYSHGTFRSDLGYTVKHPLVLEPRVIPQPGLDSQQSIGISR